MGFEDLAKQNKQIELDKIEKNKLLKEIKEKLYLWKEQIEKYESLPQYVSNINQVFNTAINDFSNFFKEKGFTLSHNSDEIVAELNNLDLKFILIFNQDTHEMKLFCTERGYGKFNYNISLKEGNELHKNSNVCLWGEEEELFFSNSKKKEDISYLKAELEAIELDLTKLKNRTRTDFTINFLLYWEEKETEHISIIEILEQIENEYFNKGTSH